MALDPVTAGLDLAKTVVSTIWPDKSAQEQAQLAAALQLVQGQMDTNKAEAASGNAFASSWRPMIGYICGFGCAWNWIGLPIARFIAAYLGHPINVSPADVSEMMPVLLGMLGLGGLRTVEKIKGVAS
jgi:hypothetical protein